MIQLQQRLLIALTMVILAMPSADAQFGTDSGLSGTDSAGTGGGDSGTVGGLDANEAFSDLSRGDEVGSTENTGRGFSGSSVSAPSAGGGGVTPGGIGGGIGGFGGVGGFGNMFDRMNSQATQTEPPVIRTRLRSAVQVRPRPPGQIERRATVRLRSLPSRTDLRTVQVAVQGRTAVLSGTVPSQSDRRMSQLLMRLEPGISKIENRISVQP